MVSLKLSECCPPRINNLLGISHFFSRAFFSRFGVQPQAIGATHRLERQCKHYRVSERGFKIHVITVNPILVGLRRSIREELSKIDFSLGGKLCEAAPTLGNIANVGDDGSENPLVY